MAGVTYCLEITVIIRAAVCFGFDMVNRCCRGNDPLLPARLADEVVAPHNAFARKRPGVAISSLLVCSSRALRLPAFPPMLLAVSASVRCRACATMLTTRSGYSWWHIITFTVSVAMS